MRPFSLVTIRGVAFCRLCEQERAPYYASVLDPDLPSGPPLTAPGLDD